MKKHLQKIAELAARGLRALATLAGSWRPDALIAAGSASIAYGAWLVYQPAGFITGGVLLLSAGVLAARKGG